MLQQRAGNGVQLVDMLLDHFASARQAILDSWPRALDDACARRDWDWRPAWDLARMSDDLTPKLAALAARAGK